MSEHRPRVFPIDDHELIRVGIRAKLLDPDGGGVAILQAVHPVNSVIRFLALSVSDAAEDVITIIRKGARSYVTKNISGPELLDATYCVGAGGYSYRDTAHELGISSKTVESHVSSVLRKLQLSNRHQLSHWVSLRSLS